MLQADNKATLKKTFSTTMISDFWHRLWYFMFSKLHHFFCFHLWMHFFFKQMHYINIFHHNKYVSCKKLCFNLQIFWKEIFPTKNVNSLFWQEFVQLSRTWTFINEGVFHVLSNFSNAKYFDWQTIFSFILSLQELLKQSTKNTEKVKVTPYCSLITQRLLN